VKRTTKKRKSTRRGSQPEFKWLGSTRTWLVVAWIGTFCAMAYGLHRLEPYTQAIKLDDTSIEWVGAPAWLADANWRHVLPELEGRVQLDPDTDPFDERVCPWVAERLAGSAWVERVRRVTKQTDGHVKVYASFRKPFAMVEQAGVAYLVDDAGVRLPEQWASGALNRSGWFVIRGVAAAVPATGERWHGEDLAAGLKLARFLYRAESANRLPFRDEIHAIDVANFHRHKDPRAGRLRLVTRNRQTYIHWGLPPGEEYDIESSAELKLKNLTRLYASRGRFPDRRSIDVRADDSIWLKDGD